MISCMSHEDSQNRVLSVVARAPSSEQSTQLSVVAHAPSSDFLIKNYLTVTVFVSYHLQCADLQYLRPLSRTISSPKLILL